MKIKNLVLSDKVIEHVLSGDFTNGGIKQIAGGLHTHEALYSFLEDRDDLENLNERDGLSANEKCWYYMEGYDNGVSFIRLPTHVFTIKGLRATAHSERYLSSLFASKTLFPNDFSDKDLIKVIEDVINTGHVVTLNKGSTSSLKNEKSICGRSSFVGKSIYAEVIIRDDRIASCYPTLKQDLTFKDKVEFVQGLDYISNIHPDLKYEGDFFSRLDLQSIWKDPYSMKEFREEIFKISNLEKLFPSRIAFKQFVDEAKKDNLIKALPVILNPHDLAIYSLKLRSSKKYLNLLSDVVNDFYKMVDVGDEESFEMCNRFIRNYNSSYMLADRFSVEFYIVQAYSKKLLGERDPGRIDRIVFSCLNSPLLSLICRSHLFVEALTDILNDQVNGIDRNLLDPFLLKVLRKISNDESDYSMSTAIFIKSLRRFLEKEGDRFELLRLLR